MSRLLQRLRHRWAVASGHVPMREDAITLVQSRIFVLPSGRGLFIIAVAIVLLLIAVNYQLALAYLVAFLLGGLMQVALHATYRNLAGLVVRPGRSPLVQEGERLIFMLALASPGRRREGLRARATARGASAASKATPSPVTDVPADGTAHIELALGAHEAPLSRGVHPIGRITLESSAPYGLIRAWSHVHFPWVGLVTPKPEASPPPLPHSAGEPNGPGRVTQVAHDPDELREYAPGDSLRRVAWKQVAKSGRWYTRTGSSASRSELQIDWHAIPLPDTGRLARITAWIERARNENAAYRLNLPNGSLPMADGAAQARDAMVLLAAYPESPESIDGLRL